MDKVTRIGLGMAALGRPGYINLGHADDLNENYSVEAMEQHAHTVLDAAWAGGIRYFDAARSYGKGEAFLGHWLRSRGIAHNDVTIGSKWGYTYTADWQIDAEHHEIKEHSLPVLNRQWRETQANLADYLNLYQIHSATLASGVLENAPVLNRLAELKRDGVLIGLSVSGAKQPVILEKAFDIELEGIRLFDAVQITWNLLEPSASPILQQVHAAGMRVIVKETLANGRLTPKNAQADFFALLQEQATRLETTIDALALAAVLAQPWADVVLSGAATVAHVQSNLQALDIVWDAAASHALASLAEDVTTYWQTRSSLTWN